MRKVTKDYAQTPSSLNSCTKNIQNALTEKGSHKFSNSIYASDTVKKSLNEIYKNKCAYCETDTTAGSVLQVEHYRPKAKVTEDSKHEGYYWLGYEWSNLMYSCSSCNRAKSTSFPIDLQNGGKRIYNPPMTGLDLDKTKYSANDNDLMNEKPLLLNPEEQNFNPETHLIIGPNGEIKGRTTRGNSTIQICKLDRKNLILARKKIVDIHLRNLMAAFYKYSLNEITKNELIVRIKVVIETIIQIIIENQPYTLLAKFMLKYFEFFFIKRFQTNEQLILKDVFQSYKSILTNIV